MFSPGFAKTAAVESQLSSIPQKDRIQIEKFLSYLVCRENLGFVIFGNTKPGCIASIPLTHKRALLPIKVDSPLRYQRDLRQAWDKWKYYQHRFSHPRFIICEEFKQENGGMYLKLFILDKERLNETLERYHDAFSEVLGEQFCPKKFISKIERKKKLRPLIKRDHKLLGLILGFDLDSCIAFKDRFDGKELKTPMKLVSSRLKGSPVVPVSYIGDPEAEVAVQLIERYQEETPMIEKILADDMFLPQTIECLKNKSNAQGH